MSLALPLRIAGLGLIVLAALHFAFPKRFHWKEELARLSPLNRQIFQVHVFFMVVVLLFFGSLSLFLADTLLVPGPLSRAVLAGFTLFWLLRLAVRSREFSRAARRTARG